MSDPHLESIAAYKRMIKYFERQIAILETKVYNERCCWEYKRKRIQLPVIRKTNEANNKTIKKIN